MPQRKRVPEGTENNELKIPWTQPGLYTPEDQADATIKELIGHKNPELLQFDISYEKGNSLMITIKNGSEETRMLNQFSYGFKEMPGFIRYVEERLTEKGLKRYFKIKDENILF